MVPSTKAPSAQALDSRHWSHFSGIRGGVQMREKRTLAPPTYVLEFLTSSDGVERLV